jgi:hypothetical protein
LTVRRVEDAGMRAWRGSGVVLVVTLTPGLLPGEAGAERGDVPITNVEQDAFGAVVVTLE